MAINVKNVATGETILVNNANQQNGVILAHWKSPAPKADGKFFTSHPFFVYTDKFVNYASKNIECRVIELADGYGWVTESKEQTEFFKRNGMNFDKVLTFKDINNMSTDDIIKAITEAAK